MKNPTLTIYPKKMNQMSSKVTEQEFIQKCAEYTQLRQTSLTKYYELAELEYKMLSECADCQKDRIGTMPCAKHWQLLQEISSDNAQDQLTLLMTLDNLALKYGLKKTIFAIPTKEELAARIPQPTGEKSEF